MTNAVTQLAPQLLAWWDSHGRHDLPWQRDPTPYRVWVSEIMLQQTQVLTVERYYERFLAAFPDVQALANAAADDVLHLWSGLGYYSRARNLHKAAQLIVAEHDGRLPESIEQLVALPGIGRSTAGAILALAGNRRFAILDGNVKRVLARMFRVEGWPGSTANLKTLWQLAESCTPQQRVADYTQAIMDLGATLCSRSRPACGDCPLQEHCAAYAADCVASIPARRAKKVRPRRAAVVVMAVTPNGDILLQKRPPSGIWGGLWSFPELDSINAVADWCAAELGMQPVAVQTWAEVSHSFSHFDFDMTPVEVTVARPPDRVMEGSRWLWYNTRSPASIGLAAPVARLLQTMDSRPDSVAKASPASPRGE